MPTDQLRERAVSDTVHHTTFAHPDKSTGSYTTDGLKYGVIGAILSGLVGGGVGALSNYVSGGSDSNLQAALKAGAGSAVVGGSLGTLGGLISRKLQNDEEQEVGKGLNRARKINIGENTLIGGLTGVTAGSLLHGLIHRHKPMNSQDALTFLGGGATLGAGLGFLASPHHNDEHDFYRTHVKQAGYYRPENESRR